MKKLILLIVSLSFIFTATTFAGTSASSKVKVKSTNIISKDSHDKTTIYDRKFANSPGLINPQLIQFAGNGPSGAAFVPATEMVIYAKFWNKKMILKCHKKAKRMGIDIGDLFISGIVPENERTLWLEIVTDTDSANFNPKKADTNTDATAIKNMELLGWVTGECEKPTKAKSYYVLAEVIYQAWIHGASALQLTGEGWSNMTIADGWSISTGGVRAGVNSEGKISGVEAMGIGYSHATAKNSSLPWLQGQALKTK